MANAIGRLWRDLPRRTDLTALPEQLLIERVRGYNNTPRKCPGCQTPAEVFAREGLQLNREFTMAHWLEDLGYEYLAAGEHFMRGNPPGPTNAALPLLAVAAGATKNIRLLSSILLTPFYHPLTLAKLTATLDIASNGRLTLGVGVGGEFPMEFAAAGLDVTQRGRRTNECLAILRRLWSETGVSYQGRHFQLDAVTLNPPPTQRPGPPVWVAGRRAAAIRRAGRYGDGWLPYFYSPQRYRDSVAQIQQLAHDENRDLSAFQWAFFPYIALYPTEQEAAEVAATALGGRYLYGGDFLTSLK